MTGQRNKDLSRETTAVENQKLHQQHYFDTESIFDDLNSLSSNYSAFQILC